MMWLIGVYVWKSPLRFKIPSKKWTTNKRLVWSLTLFFHSVLLKYVKRVLFVVVSLPELEDSSQTSSNPSDRNTQQGIVTGRGRCCRFPDSRMSWSSWRTEWSEGGKKDSITSFNPPRLFNRTLWQKTTNMCSAYFRDFGLISRGSFHPRDGQGGINTAR